MRVWLTFAAVLLVPACTHAQAAQGQAAQGQAAQGQAAQGPKPCEELKSEIAAKLDAKGVKSYSLEIVPKDQDAEGKVVGTCGGGTKKITYRRTTAPPPTPPKEPSKP